MHTDRCARPQDGDQGGVDNETASDPVHLWSPVHYPNGHHSLLLITAPSLSLLRCSCRFSSRYLSAHLHRSADGFRGRWWDYKSGAAPSDYHHRDQLSTHSSTLKTQNVLIGNDAQLLRHAKWVSNGWVSSSSSLPFVKRWQTLCVYVWLKSYESSNGIPSLMWGPRPIRSPVSRENVSHDLEELEQVYDIISALPLQRYYTDSPDSLIYPQGLKSCKQSQNVATGRVPSASFFPKQNETLHIVRQHGERFELNQKGTHWKPNRKPTSVLWVRHRDTGYRHFSRVFSLWQGFCYLSGICLCHLWCQSKQTSEAVIRTGRSQGINTAYTLHHIHTLRHSKICKYIHKHVHTHTWAYTQRNPQMYTVGTPTRV